MNEETDLEFMTLWESHIWTKAVLYEANEILRINEKSLKLWESDSRNMVNQMNQLRDHGRVREYFFVISLTKLEIG
jgi:hypothetical protein